MAASGRGRRPNSRGGGEDTTAGSDMRCSNLRCQEAGALIAPRVVTVKWEEGTDKWAQARRERCRQVGPVWQVSKLKISSKSISSAGKIHRKGIKIQENLWRLEIQFGTLFIIKTSSKSPRILN
jgi:hypothetical protein